MILEFYHRATKAFRLSVLLSAGCGFSLVLRSASMLFDKPLDEDGFYCLTIARNIARGLGVTADGETLTNGFQPLWVLILSGLFYLVDADRSLGVRLAFLASAAMHISAGVLLGHFAARTFSASEVEKRCVFWLTVGLYCGSGMIWMHSFNGMETGLLLVGYCGVLLAFSNMTLGDRKSEILFGVLLGLLGLIRIDTGFFAATLLGACCLIDGRPIRARLGSVILMGAVAVLITSPWWQWNILEFGSLMPSSGRALQEFAISSLRGWELLRAIAVNLLPGIYLSLFENWLTIVFRFGAIAILLWIAISQAKTISVSPHFKQSMTVLGALLLTCLLLAAWYNFYSKAFFFYLRYMAPLSLIGTLLVVIAAMKVLRSISAFSRARQVANLGIAVALPTLIFTAIAHAGIIFQGHSMLHHQVPLVLRVVPGNEWIASTQSGTLSFMRDRVLNLDGKVNPEALARKHDISTYLDEKGVRWFVDWPDFAFGIFGKDMEKQGWRAVDTYGSMILYRRQD